jgi:aspartyl-tRNA(Asn)/glutamyl-tRNA(Gln) amidotransferase subunit A
MTDESAGVSAVAAAVRDGEVTAVDVTRAALARIGAANATLNCFTALTEARALAEATAIDAAIAAGQKVGPLAGVPYAVKNLFDVKGTSTIAGSRIDKDRTPALRDASLVRRLTSAGAVLVGTVNMDEYAMGYTTENAHYGPTRNPHDTNRMAGGSSGGSAAAVAAGLVPVALGTDTGGSIGVPASLCGVYGLKPTFGRLSRAGTRLLAASFDHAGPFARSVSDLASVYDALQGHDADDPASVQRNVEPVSPDLDKGMSGVRVAVWDGGVETRAAPEALGAVAEVAAALGASRTVTLPEAARARAAAMIITGSEASNNHYSNLRTRADDFDPLTRDRLLAATLIPSAWNVQAHRFRRWFRTRMLELFQSVDLVLAPATPFSAPLIGQMKTRIGDAEVLTRRHIGAFTQPLSFLGFPVLTVPTVRPGEMPIGVMIIAAPWRESLAFRAAAVAENNRKTP